MIKHLADHKDRQAAINPANSYIVQAPAGSGKTELLVQRILKLLIHCEQPENIVAITFTRKAAQEMRDRIIDALQQAQHGLSDTATQQLAQDVLTKDKHAKWELLAQPQRLCILTFDALCAKLMLRMPALTGLGGVVSIMENATSLYQHTATLLLQQLIDSSNGDTAMAMLMQHLDLNSDRLCRLIVQMLAQRDQWLPYLMPFHKNNLQAIDFKNFLEDNLAQINLEIMSQLQASIAPETANSLMQCIHFAWEHGLKPPAEAPPLKNENTLPPVDIGFRPYWLALANLVLTKNGQWRRQLNKSQGFPAISSASNKDKHNYAAMKSQCQQLITSMQHNPNLLSLWQRLQQSPGPNYDAEQWQLLLALVDLLPLCVAQLQQVFIQTSQLDFIEVMQRALLALGDEDNPTDLALYLEYQIKHVLVDEFQDTSLMQFRLLKQLTTTWIPHDGHSLFLVGDPMQSIYRFRQAEVGLFVQAQQSGIGNLALQCLYLSSNFRSQTPLVEWFNQYLGTLFPAHSDPNSGAIPYRPATPILTDDAHATVNVHPLIDSSEAQMAHHLVTLITRHTANYPEHHIAILVRARSHAAPLFKALTAAHLSYQALDMDRLIDYPLIQDLLTLTRSLYHLADKTAWLALLRAPWCGINLQDLHTLASKQASLTIWECLNHLTLCQQLSAHGQQRINHIRNILSISLQQRNRTPLRQWVEATWLALNGPACLHTPHQITIADAYWDALENCQQQTEEYFINSLERQLQRAFVPVDPTANEKLSIMTIHKAKGLEFDCVILANLERRPPADNAPLLHWLEYFDQQHQSRLLLAPIQAQHASVDPIFHYLKQCHQNKQQHEYLRLLYVAITRAKQQLHLVMNLSFADDGELLKPAAHSFLALLWPILQEQLKTHPQVYHANTENSVNSGKNLHDNVTSEIDNITARGTPYNLTRLAELSPTIVQCKPIAMTQSTAMIANQKENHSVTLHSSGSIASCIGSTIHYFLQQISDTSDPDAALKNILHSKQIIHALKQSGITASDLATAKQHVAQALANTLLDPRGRWLLQPHPQAHSEFEISYFKNNEVQQYIIDRTFIADNIRWLIDYKTSPYQDTLFKQEKKLKQFLVQQQQKHSRQLELYAHALYHYDPHHPIHCALYFPMITAWHSWKTNINSIHDSILP